MGYKKHKPTVYLVRWPDGVAKVGYTDCKRWRKFVIRGATLVGIWSFFTTYDALTAEIQVRKSLKCNRAFKEKNESLQYLGHDGGGWTECLQVPLTVENSTLLQRAVTVTTSFKQC
jgi:hypothetical protein